MPSKQRGWVGLWWAMVSLWLVLVLAGVGSVAMTAAFHDESCFRNGDANPGMLSWSAMPPGHICTWTREQSGFDAVQGPGAWPSIYLALMATTGLILLTSRPPRTERLRVSIFEPEADAV